MRNFPLSLGLTSILLGSTGWAAASALPVLNSEYTDVPALHSQGETYLGRESGNEGLRRIADLRDTSTSGIVKAGASVPSATQDWSGKAGQSRNTLVPLVLQASEAAADSRPWTSSAQPAWVKSGMVASADMTAVPNFAQSALMPVRGSICLLVTACLAAGVVARKRMPGQRHEALAT